MKNSVKSFAIPAVALLMSMSILANTSRASIAPYFAPIVISEAVFNGLGAVAVGSAVGAFYTGYYSGDHGSQLSDTLVMIFVGTLVVGLVLDDSGNQKVVLQPLSEDAAAKAKLSAQELLAYNSELDVTQQVFDQISTEVANASEQDRVSVAKTGWEKYRGLMSNDAFTALTKLTAAAK
jgi:hypothetical protein